MRRLLVASFFLLLACGGDDGLDFVGGEPELFFQGVLAAPTDVRVLPGSQGTVETHAFELLSSGTVRVELTEVSATNDATGEPVENPSLAVGLGNSLGELCIPSVTNPLAAGESYVIFLTPGAFCIRVSRTFTVPVNAAVEYLVTVSPGLS